MHPIRYHHSPIDNFSKTTTAGFKLNAYSENDVTFENGSFPKCIDY